MKAFAEWMERRWHNREALRVANGVRVPATLESMMREAFAAGAEWADAKKRPD